MHGVNAVHAESVSVRETFKDKVVWEGVVEVFNIVGHPRAKICYGWSYSDGNQTRYFGVLGLPPVKNPLTAVRAAILAESKSKAAPR